MVLHRAAPAWMIGVRGTLVSILLLAMAGPATAEWSVEAAANAFYTDDVSLFSASRRLALMEDPTQPVVDVTGQGGDMVSEPALEVVRSFTTGLGQTELSFRTQGFIFAQNPIFNHGTYRFQAAQEVGAANLVRLDYYYAPHLFLAHNFERQTGSRLPEDELVTTQIWSVHLERRLAETLNVRLLGRYGIRTYNAVFSERDTHLWTIGPHVEWAITPRIHLTMGYHYERGLAAGRNQPQFMDDTSYVNHYAAAGLSIRLLERTTLSLGLDYERIDFTSQIVGDPRQGAHEDVYQGEAQIRRSLTDAIAVTLGFQRTQRQSTLERRTVADNNFWLGGEYRF